MSIEDSTPPTSAPSTSEPSTFPNTTAPSTYNGDTDADVNGDAESSKMAEQTLSQPQLHALHFTDYVFNVGYLQQRWADVQLTFFSDALKLHRIILARSPYLAQYMMNAAPGTTIHLQFRDENIISEAVHTCIQHLYNPTFHLVNPSNARSILATALHLGGMPDLVHHAYTVCRDSITADSLSEWISWTSATVVPPEHQQMNGDGYTNGVTVPTGEEAWDENGWYGRYGEYSDRLKQDIYDFLTITLPSGPTTATPSTPLAHLLPYYTTLPFPLFKRVVESSVLPFKDKQAQFGFAKKAIALRKKKGMGASTGMEEAAVLAFRGGEGGMAVEITRKGKKGRPALWKVEG